MNNSEEKNWEERFDKLFWLHRVPKNTKQMKDIKSFIAAELHSLAEGMLEETIGNIGAKLLARHSPQAVLDAYFDAANEELEANRKKYETNN